MIKPFNPSPAGTIAVAHATTATPPISLPEGCDTLAVYNSSETVTAYLRITNLASNSGTGAGAVIPVAGGVNGDFPIPPLMQLRILCAAGPKTISIISSGTDASKPVLFTPGTGN